MSKTLGELPIGAKVKFGKIYDKSIVWLIADRNHDGYPDNSTTLVTEKIIKLMCFDAAEPSNSNSDRKSYGNNRYMDSNIRQWLNSSAAAGEWYTAQHDADAPPTSANCNDGYNPYDTAAGFLNGFTQQERDALLTTTLTITKTVSFSTSTDVFIDKVFYLSCTEVGLSSDEKDSSKLAIFSDDNSRIAYPTQDCVTNSTYTDSNLATSKAWQWWLRDAGSLDLSRSCSVSAEGAVNNYSVANNGRIGVRPACNISPYALVSDEPDSDGAYVVQGGVRQIHSLNDASISDPVKIYENGEPVNYIIVHKGLPSDMYDESCDGIWVVRQQLHSNMKWNAVDNKNDYENSSIHAWLNSTFINTIDEKIREAIKTVKIPYRKGNGVSNTVQSSTNGLSCKVFLLSGYEVGFTTTDSQYLPVDGAKLSYFLNGNSDANAKTKRLCMDSSSFFHWFLRSPSLQPDDYVDYDEFRVFLVTEKGSFSFEPANGGQYPNDRDYGARPAFVLPPTLLVNSDGTLSTNTVPTITSDTASGSDLGEISEPINLAYTVNDADGDTVTVTEYLDDVQTRTYTATLGEENTFEAVSDPELFQKILNGQHTLKIVANDGTDDSEPYTVTFDKQVKTASVSMVSPLPADDVIRAAVISVTGQIPQDATVEVLVTNNGLDENPVWEDMTEDFKKKINHVFANKTAANGFAFNFKVTVTRGASEEQGFIEQIGGAFE